MYVKHVIKKGRCRKKTSQRSLCGGYIKKSAAVFCKKAVFVCLFLCSALLFAKETPVWAAENNIKLAAGSALAEMSIEDLMNIEVTLASKKPEKYLDTPAAIYVITNEDIKRSGVTSIAEALRLAPGVEVARIDSTRWAVSVRGLSDKVNKRMLVLIDGRSVYSPVLAGVYWEAQDYLLEDIERIEIIRGPGGSVWGANAVSGIVNIITKNAKDTQGGFVSLGGGTEEQGFAGVRYGDMIGKDFSYRLYAKGFNRDAMYHEDADNYDDWQMEQGGFSTFWDLKDGNTLRFQGDLYDANLGQRTAKNIDSTGGNILGRWQRSGDDSDMALQFYYDRTYRNEQNIQGTVDTFDLDFQYSAPLSPRQELVWGLGYRFNCINTEGTPGDIYFDPDHHNNNLFSAFVQDEIILVKDKLNLTIGSKFEHNDYSGYEVQPSARIMWKPTSDQTVWASASRAVRTPSPMDQDLVAWLIPSFLALNGDKGFETEELGAYELGYRVQPMKRLAIDMTAYYNVYDNLLSAEGFFFFGNKLSGDILGGEISIDYTPFDWWKLHASQSIMHIDMEKDADSTDPSTVDSMEHSSPERQTTVRSYIDLPHDLSFDCTFRSVSRLPVERDPIFWISGYNSMDVRFAWDINPDLEISLVGQNLLDDHHPEYNPTVLPLPGYYISTVEIQRGVYMEAQWKF
jgi:iron complex outermembrane receptor protein